VNEVSQWRSRAEQGEQNLVKRKGNLELALSEVEDKKRFNEALKRDVL